MQLKMGGELHLKLNIGERLRIMERKMGLVLTLFKASVWGVVNDQTFSAHPPESSADDIH